jgi:hypothetical protein
MLFINSSLDVKPANAQLHLLTTGFTKSKDVGLIFSVIMELSLLDDVKNG